MIGEIVAEDGSMCRGERLTRFVAKHDLPVLAIADLVRYRRATERFVEHGTTSAMPTGFGDFRLQNALTRDQECPCADFRGVPGAASRCRPVSGVRTS
ncbi:hypothetical protein QRX50_20740 [Amycolatopsis carbonis]|uniref:3,4-dihydroxy-2-butanone-4-phosphate synthase n=1 Tax=Amycolatopsis carbonis TaxID=715471 RepID=A0A9Y2IQP3_9PSEU|nr:hypothetical protein [Amycolatopsis sp. 2-15]WIX83013.1 hypothetical protein QRX50_20740 [Amycolatopsis sp. 2-15]